MVVVDGAHGGTLEGIARYAYDGTPRPVDAAELAGRARSRPATSTAAAFPHFLLKEISEAPDSFRKTLRGKIVDDADGGLTVRLDPSTLPDQLRARLRDGTIRRVVVIGQGTAAVAGQSLAAGARRTCSTARSRCRPSPPPSCPASGCADDMTDTLVVAISQ